MFASLRSLNVDLFRFPKPTALVALLRCASHLRELSMAITADHDSKYLEALPSPWSLQTLSIDASVAASQLAFVVTPVFSTLTQLTLHEVSCTTPIFHHTPNLQTLSLTGSAMDSCSSAKWALDITETLWVMKVHKTKYSTVFTAPEPLPRLETLILSSQNTIPWTFDTLRKMLAVGLPSKLRDLQLTTYVDNDRHANVAWLPKEPYHNLTRLVLHCPYTYRLFPADNLLVLPLLLASHSTLVHIRITTSHRNVGPVFAAVLAAGGLPNAQSFHLQCPTLFCAASTVLPITELTKISSSSDVFTACIETVQYQPLRAYPAAHFDMVLSRSEDLDHLEVNLARSSDALIHGRHHALVSVVALAQFVTRHPKCIVSLGHSENFLFQPFLPRIRGGDCRNEKCICRLPFTPFDPFVSTGFN